MFSDPVFPVFPTLRITLNCLSVAFFNTAEYTRFFSLEEALRMNSENAVDSTVFDLENNGMVFSLQLLNPSRKADTNCDFRSNSFPICVHISSINKSMFNSFISSLTSALIVLDVFEFAILLTR